MKTATRSILILGATLLLRVMLGVLISGAFVHHRQQHMAAMRHMHGFAQHIMELIAPRDEQQRAALQPHVDSTAHQNERIVRDAHMRIVAHLDTLRARIDPLLEPEQRTRLDEAVSRLHR